MCNNEDFKAKKQGGSYILRDISKELLENYKEIYKKGTRVKLVSMNDPYSRLKPGDLGTVDFVDSMATIHIFWDCGSTLGVAYGEDLCEIVDVEK